MPSKRRNSCLERRLKTKLVPKTCNRMVRNRVEMARVMGEAQRNISKLPLRGTKNLDAITLLLLRCGLKCSTQPPIEEAIPLTVTG